MSIKNGAFIEYFKRFLLGVCSTAIVSILLYLYILSDDASIIYNKSEIDDDLSRTEQVLFLTPKRNNTNKNVGGKVTIESVRDNREWVINQNTIQYSVYIIKLPNNKYKIESFIINEGKTNENYLKCAIRDYDNKVHLIDTTELYLNEYGYNDKKLYYGKCACQFTIAEGLLSQNQLDLYRPVAIIDSRFYQNTTDSDSSASIFSFDFIFYQIPQIIDALLPKIKGCAHCVHRVLIDDDDKLQSAIRWLSLQKQVGYRHVKMNAIKIQDHIYKSLMSVHEINGFLEIVICENEDTICAIPYTLSKYSNNNILYKSLYNKCIQMAKHLSIDNGHLIGLYEKLTGNDCYMRLRHIYEVVTNYDFDELIIPHTINIGEVVQTKWECHKIQLSEDLSRYKYSLYDYADRLIRKNKKDTPGSLELSHGVVVKMSKNLETFLEDLEDLVESVEADDSSLPAKIKYFDTSNVYVEFIIKKEDIEYTRQLISNYKYAKCFINEVMAKTVYKTDSNFNRFFTIITPVRMGKSIYNSEYTELINQHSADLFNQNGRIVSIPLEDGFCSHFRQNYNGLLQNRTYNIKYAFVDIDYLFIQANALL